MGEEGGAGGGGRGGGGGGGGEGEGLLECLLHESICLSDAMDWVGNEGFVDLVSRFSQLAEGGGEMLEMYGATGQEEEKEEEGKEEGGQIGAEPAPRYFRE